MMLGRQHFFVPSSMVRDLMARQGLQTAEVESTLKNCVFSEPFFQLLGATQVDSLDNAEFEGANHIHDLNQPIPAEWKEQFDVVYDGGTLEHVFHFPNGLRSAMEMVRPGGRLFTHTCINNTSGHGFYQFSPELFFRALSPKNGFEMERLVVHRTGPYGSWYEVTDPDNLRERVELISFTPIYGLVQARRVKVVPLFEEMPQQTIYVDMWQTQQKETKPGWFRTSFPKLAILLSPFKTAVQFYRRQSLFNRRYFKPLSK